jgi:hypothetical protein
MQPDRNEAPQPKDSDKPPVYRNWRHRKADIARRQALAEEALARQQQSMTWRQDLIDSYITALGGPDRVTAIQRQDCERCADMTALALNMRRRALRGDPSVKIDDLTRLEGACDRARRRLALPAPGAAAAVTSLHDIVARRSAERANPPEAD